MRRSFYHELSFSNHGDPKDVVQFRKSKKPSVKDLDPCNAEVYLEMIAAPWNPADRNGVQGRYPSPYGDDIVRNKSGHFPGCTVVGSEGWGRIKTVSGAIHETEKSSFVLRPGDFVSVGLPGFGTIRSSIHLPSTAVVPIKRGKELLDFCNSCPDGPFAISTLFQLGGTALRMLRDFEAWEDGDILIQNAGNSGVGLMLSQLAVTAFNKQIHPVSLIRRGNRTQKQFDDLVEYLSTTGQNALVIAEEDLLSSADAVNILQRKLRNLSDRPPKLAVNGIGGESASVLLKLLGPGRTMVTYGGMAMKPVSIGTSQLIFKDVRAVGYWHSRWMIRSSLNFKTDLRASMIDELVNLVLDSKVVNVPTKVFPLRDISKALDFEASQSAVAIREKVVFNCIDVDESNPLL